MSLVNKLKKAEFKKRLYKLVLDVIDLIEKLPNDRVCKVIGDQLLRSITSVIGNFIEGQAASSKKDYLKYFEICLKSSNESKVWVSILRDKNKINKEIAKYFLNELDEISKIFASIILTLKGKR